MKITIPCVKGQTRQAEGKVALLQVGETKHRFFIHDGHLSDYRSGYGVGDLRAIKVERMARLSHHTRTSDRQAAAILVERIIARYGIADVLAKLASMPTVNR